LGGFPFLSILQTAEEEEDYYLAIVIPGYTARRERRGEHLFQGRGGNLSF